MERLNQEDTEGGAARVEEETITAEEPAQGNRPSGYLASLTRNINAIEAVLANEANLKGIEEKYEELKKRVAGFITAFDVETKRLGIQNADRQDLEDGHEEKRQVIVKSNLKIQNWIESGRNNTVSPRDSASVVGSCVSTLSKVSKTSSAARVELARKKAEMEAQREIH